MKQIRLLKDEPKAYGGDLLKTRKGRAQGRPLDAKNTMHLVLRSTKAVGPWSFWIPKTRNEIKRITSRFSQKYGIKILSMANVGNHLHFHIKLSSRHTFRPFIRALTSAIAMAASGVNRWNKAEEKLSFWDRRPFTRVVRGLRAYLNLKDYIEINRLEGFGFQKPQARFFFRWNQLKEANLDSGP